ncbi:MAG: Polypeptide-transport-associated domain protein ShlB-type [Rickettsiaceae bacterium]|nr:Polypeptide-transport-associated domain protein ShlB-type [Rickettsiaceae bacterium]
MRYSLLLVILVLSLPGISYSQITPADQERALRNLQQNQQNQQNFIKSLEEQQQRKMRERKTPEINVEKQPEKEIKGGKCFNISSIEFSGATILKGGDKDKIAKDYLNTCVSINEINKLMREVTNYYIDKGYVTTRVALPQQDLKSGKLQIMVVEGTVEDIILNENTWRDRAQVTMALPFIKGKLLNLRDIEQGLDQLNRLSSSNATMQLVPGDKAGGTKVVITNKVSKPNRASLGYDNSGQKATGVNKVLASLERDNLFGIGEALSFNYNENAGGESDTKHSQVYSGMLSVPFGYWTFSQNFSHSEYLQTIRGTNQNFHASGQTDSGTSKIERVVFRNQDSKLSLNTSLELKDTKAFVEDAQIAAGTYQLTVWSAGADYTLRALNSIWTLGAAYKRGIDAFSAKKDSYGITEDTPHAQFDKYTFDASVYKPFAISNANLAWRSVLFGQYSNDTLFSSERMTIGDRYTVRGFSDDSLSGDSGVYNRNELIWNLPQFTGVLPAQ